MTGNGVHRAPVPPRAAPGWFRAAAGTLLAVAAALAGLAVGSMAEAATIQINGVSGSFVSKEGGNRVTGIGTNHLAWGGLSKNRRSGYIFKGISPASYEIPDPVGGPTRTEFDVGTFTHKNYKIPTGSGVRSAGLLVSFDAAINNTPVPVTPLFFSFDHWETPNQKSTCADGGRRGQGVNLSGCADRITIGQNPSTDASVSVGGITYLFSVTGFTAGGVPLQQWWTQENKDNVAVLRAQVTAVPVPAAGVLLLGGLGVLAAAGMRKRAA
jgi:hypothetical protein